MIEDRIKRDRGILFKITKKEADFVRKLPRPLQDEFEDYQKLKYKFHCLSMSYSKMASVEFVPIDALSFENR
jgi:hypothetical protein